MNTLTQIFDWLLAASLRASLLTLATLLVQVAFRRHLTARMHYALWLPVLVVLLMPVLPQSRWSIEYVFQAQTQPAPSTPAAVSPLMAEAAPVVFDSVTPMPEPIHWQQVFLLAWLGVSAGMLVFGSVSFMLTLRRFKQARQPASDELLATLAQIASEMHLRYVPRVLIASSVSSPAVTGLLRPTLLLPTEFDREFTPAETRLVLKHELMHLKRGDLSLNALMCVLMALHWFNPLLWIAFFKIRADREAACDAQVLQNATRDHRIAYGHALLKVETAFSPRGLSLGFVGIFQRGAALRSRIQSIAKHRTPHPTMKAMITMCIVLMTFFGVTRAQQPKPAEDAPLIAIEVKIVEFEKATDWNFDGRLPAEETQPFLPVLLSADEFTVQLRELLRNDRTNVTSYPRIVTANEKEVVIKSIVNQPSKDKDGKIAYVPIGLVCKFTPTVSGDAVNLGIDITNSELFDPATGAVVSEIKGEYANARSRVYKSNQQMQTGQSCVIAGWHDGKPQSKRPVLYIITPHVIDPKRGGLAAAAPSDFAVGKSVFRPRDSMVITSMTRSAEMLTVGVDYELGSADEATATLNITSTTDHKAAAFDARQQALLKRGRGSFILHLPNPSQGLPHITFYDTLTHKPFGGIYFGTEAEAARSRALDLSYMTSSAQTKAASSALNPPDKISEIVITAKETSIDPSTEIQTAKGDARCQVGDTSIQAAELICDRKAHQLKIRGPFTIISGGSQKHNSTSSESSAVLDLASGKLTTSGAHVTEILPPPATKAQASSPIAQPSPNAAEPKAAELRKARPQQYDFAKANLGDVLRFLATDASINFISLPDDNPINQKLVTFSINGSPFGVLETLCRANGLVLTLDQNRWFIRVADDSALVTKEYALPKTQASIETILKDISTVIEGDETKPVADAPHPSVTFKKEQNSVSVKATRLQHTWISAYFQGLSSSAQSTKTN
ncbi:MAG: M56 family metallopeptidase [Prosthecobacter sp.]|uniref:M56 family metallopeptidase n=1 Tax=Prosthecobacter sp. TaxID=1965333 RepID=UPI003BB07F34